MAKKNLKKEKKRVKKGICKCCLCGYKFQLTAEDRKTIQVGVGLNLLTGGNPRYFDSWDCPACGAENRLNERFRDDRNENKEDKENKN